MADPRPAGNRQGGKRPPTDADPPGGPPAVGGLGTALRQSWLRYQRQLDQAMTEAGYRGRQFSDGQVLRLCSAPTGSTISGIGREIGITRQGAAKVVVRLRDDGYLTALPSPTSGREKSVTITAQGEGYLMAQREAVHSLDRRLRAGLGTAGFTALEELLGELEALDPPP